MIDYVREIRKMKDKGIGLMPESQYLSIAHEIDKHCPCSLLVFGLGEESKLWYNMNKDGKTVFLEDAQKWINLSPPELSVVKVVYHTKAEDAENIGFDDSRLYMDIDDDVLNEKWNVIFVDAPLGHQPPRPWAGPGRMSSIFYASKILKDGGTVIVDDMGRKIERDYAYHYFGQENMFKCIDGKIGFFRK